MTIWKFPLTIADEQTIAIPRDARILAVQVQQGEVCLWAAVAPESPPVFRTIHMRGTGHPLGQADSMPYIGTVQQAGGALVWHVFDGGEVADGK